MSTTNPDPKTLASNQPPLVSETIRIGVSSCLLGEPVRFDSGHKRDRFVDDTLREYFTLVPVCPEVAIGLGTPREPIRLQGDSDNPRAVGTKNPDLDVTDALADFGRDQARALGDISGYILKSKSPSCGMERVKIYSAKGGAPNKKGVGIYARELMREKPLLPMEEEGRLNDPVLRENFIERVYCYRRWQELISGGVTPEKLVDFHTRHKLILMAHGRQHLTALGRLVAQAGKRPIGELADEYGALFMHALSYRATRRRHTDVLFHLMGYLKRTLDSGDKAELVDLIHQYRQGQLPLIVPVTLLRHHFRRNPEPYVDKQLYLTWQPAGLSLWNNI